MGGYENFKKLVSPVKAKTDFCFFQGAMVPQEHNVALARRKFYRQYILDVNSSMNQSREKRKNIEKN